jgi:hypothetical protein
MKQIHRHTALAATSLTLVLLLMLSACSSFTNLVRSSVEGVPSWVYQPEAKANQTVFVGSGDDSIMFNARLEAYQDILAQLSLFLGGEVSQAYYRELSTTDAIAELGLKVTHEYEKTDQSGSHAYMLASAETAKLETRRTDILEEMLEREKSIGDLVSEAEEAYRANKDTQAVELYLQAAGIAASGVVSQKEYQLDALLDKAESLLSALRFSISRSDSRSATCTVYLRRRSRLLSPKVLNAPIEASFSARNSLGRNYIDSLLFNTVEDGFIDFLPYNPGIAGSGTIIFGVYLSDSLSALRDVVPEERLQTLQDTLDSIKVGFVYSMESPKQKDGLLADIHEYSDEGDLLLSHAAVDAMCAEFSIDSVSVDHMPVSASDGSSLEAEVRASGKTERYFMLGRVGVVDGRAVGDTFATVVSGSVQLWDLKTGTVIGDTDVIEAVAFGDRQEISDTAAFRKFGMIASYLLSSYLF